MCVCLFGCFSLSGQFLSHTYRYSRVCCICHNAIDIEVWLCVHAFFRTFLCSISSLAFLFGGIPPVSMMTWKASSDVLVPLMVVQCTASTVSRGSCIRSTIGA